MRFDVGRISTFLAVILFAVLVIGTVGGWLLYGTGRVPVPPVVEAREHLHVDCVWVSHAAAWEDLNANGVQEVGEPALSGVRFEVDDLAHNRVNVSAPVASDAKGVAILREFLPGCPEVEFTVRVQAPQGYRCTTPQRLKGEDRISFGFARSNT